MALHLCASILAASDAMMLAASRMRWHLAADRLGPARLALHFSAAAVAVAELATERSTPLNSLYQAAYFIIFALPLGGAITPLLRKWPGVADALTAAWFTVAVLASVDFLFLEAGKSSLVRATEALTVGSAIFAIGRDAFVAKGGHYLLLVSSSFMLSLFGWVHVTEIDAIAGLIPAWFPGRDQVPFFTAGIMAAGAVGLWLPRVRSLSALLVAVMFLSWLPLVHAARLWDHPGDASEWSFAAMAATLSASMFILARWYADGRCAQRRAAAVA